MTLGYEVSVRFRSRRLSRMAFSVARLLFRSYVATRIEWSDASFTVEYAPEDTPR